MEEEKKNSTSGAPGEARDGGEKLEEREVPDEDNTQAGTSQSTNYENFVSENHCKGCEFQGKSLRGHLKRTTKDCLQLYSAEELNLLEEHAKSIKKENTAKWQRDNKEASNQHRRNSYYKEPEKEIQRKQGEFPCNICDKTFTFQSNLDHHVRQFHNQSPDDPQSSGQQSLLQEDETNDTKCSICGADFSDKFRRDRHLYEVHPPFPERIKCTMCDTTFSRWETLLRHRGKAHDYNARDVHQAKKCGICEKIYSNLDNLNRHIKQVHGGEKLHACEECTAHYFRKEDLENHMKKGKHYRDGICPYCEERIVFKSEASWYKHFTREPSWYEGTTPSRYGQWTCENKLKKQREQIKEFLLGSTTCVHCNEVVPNKDATKHWMYSDVEAPEKSTCRTNMSKRPYITCWYCKKQIVTKDFMGYIYHIHEFGNPANGSHPSVPGLPETCHVSMGRSLDEHRKKKMEIEIKRKHRESERPKSEWLELTVMRCSEEEYISWYNW